MNKFFFLLLFLAKNNTQNDHSLSSHLISSHPSLGILIFILILISFFFFSFFSILFALFSSALRYSFSCSFVLPFLFSLFYSSHSFVRSPVRVTKRVFHLFLSFPFPFPSFRTPFLSWDGREGNGRGEEMSGRLACCRNGVGRSFGGESVAWIFCGGRRAGWLAGLFVCARGWEKERREGG